MILVGLGSNLAFCGAEPQEIIRFAIKSIDRLAPVVRISRFYRTLAWPDPGEPPFINAVVSFESALQPGTLLERLAGIEDSFGRRRGRKNAPRTLDLDLLAYGDEIRSGAVKLPHPGLASRDFVLAPLCDIAAEWVCPKSGLTAGAMLSALGPVAAEPLLMLQRSGLSSAARRTI